MKLWKIALFVLAATVSSCGTYNVKPKIQITHVLAVTEQGDTLRLPINMIKPNVYYNVISYPNRYYGGWYNSYYQPGYYNNRPIYAPSSGSSSSGNNNNNNNNNNINKPTQVNAPRPTPSVNPPATPVNPRKNP